MVILNFFGKTDYTRQDRRHSIILEGNGKIFYITDSLYNKLLSRHDGSRSHKTFIMFRVYTYFDNCRWQISRRTVHWCWQDFQASDSLPNAAEWSKWSISKHSDLKEKFDSIDEISYTFFFFLLNKQIY